ncbi:hypothetical protein VD0002_g6468 [Verticillium dahliae]|nr:hypothetical protein VD0002_g6468 [Verticillium dahliae]
MSTEPGRIRATANALPQTTIVKSKDPIYWVSCVINGGCQQQDLFSPSESFMTPIPHAHAHAHTSTEFDQRGLTTTSALPARNRTAVDNSRLILPYIWRSPVSRPRLHVMGTSHTQQALLRSYLTASDVRPAPQPLLLLGLAKEEKPSLRCNYQLRQSPAFMRF